MSLQRCPSVPAASRSPRLCPPATQIMDRGAPMNLGALLDLSIGDGRASWRHDGQLTVGPDMDAEMAKRRSEVIEWLNGLFPGLNMVLQASEEELRARLIDGTLLCGILHRFSPGSSDEIISADNQSDNIRKFMIAVQQTGLPCFKASDLEHGPMSAVVYCLWSLKDHLTPEHGEERYLNSRVKSGGERRWKTPDTSLEALSESNTPKAQSSFVFREERRYSFQESRLHRPLRSPVTSEPSTPKSPSGGHKFHEVFQLKQGRYYDLPAAKITEMMKSTSLDNAPTQSLLSVVNGILDEGIERKNGEIPQRIACLLRKVVQEIERRISTQAEHIRNQNNLIKTREEKYQSRIRVLETLANGTSDETQITMDELHLLKTEKNKIEERSKQGEEDMARLTKEKQKVDQTISELKLELETIKKTYDNQFQQMETKAKGNHVELEKKLKDAESLLAASHRKIKELETISESKFQNWNQREHVFRNYMEGQLQSVQDMRSSSDSIKHDVKMTQKRWCEELTSFGKQMKVLTDAVENYRSVLAENRKLYNEVQELKGNIRVFCRIRPFLPGENQKQTIVDYVGENGELTIVNPAKQGKDGQRVFKFNKVFSQAATQEQVYLDTQPLVRSVLDGYNVCIFAYGQTGSGKTYTMTGPDIATEKEWGVNYRALSDLFQISCKRSRTYSYEVGVQIVEIYNEQVRDLLASSSAQKKLGVLITSQQTGLAVPDASMLPVKSTSDVLDLMQIGHSNRAVSSTSLNERSSRSHSIVTIHVRGMDLKTGATSRGCLHLVDLAGSERVDRAEVLGDRLKEAQHINKSLAALGDVVFALSQKSTHIPYRNSKLTQVLQSSLGGHAKTLMFVQINPEVPSFSESLSTLKFAERASGVELGAAKNQKEGKDIRDLMEQVASLKETIARKDSEIEQLQQIKGGISRPNSNSLKQERMLSTPRTTALNRVGVDQESYSENNDEHSDQKERFGRSKVVGEVADQDSAGPELLGFGNGDSDERLSDMSDGGPSIGTETDGSIGSLAESNLFPKQVKPSEFTKQKVSKTVSRVSKPLVQKTAHAPASRTRLKEPVNSAAVLKKSTSQGASSSSKPLRLQGKAPK